MGRDKQHCRCVNGVMMFAHYSLSLSSDSILCFSRSSHYRVEASHTV